MLKEFGITQSALTALETEEQKQDYIVKAMKSKLDEDYEKWRKEVEKQEKEFHKHEAIYAESKIKFEKERTDTLQWIKLKSKYSCVSCLEH